MKMNILQKNPIEFIEICGTKNMFEWYFLIKGPSDTDYKGGYYIGKLSFNEHYPDVIPYCIILTPTGKFVINERLCIGYYNMEHFNVGNSCIVNLLRNLLADMLEINDIKHSSFIKTSKTEKQQFALSSVIHNKLHYPDLVNKFPRFLDSNGNSPEYNKNVYSLWITKHNMINNLNMDISNYICEIIYCQL